MIRGFAYQVERTVIAWLRLPPGSLLLLEAGEDIDYVRQHVADATDSGNRLLEQVKWRSSRISLRSPEVIESLENFVSHREQNPETTITFRFLTNASPARERGSGLPTSTTGLDCWNGLRERPYESAHDTELAKIRAILLDGASRSDSALAEFIGGKSLRELHAEIVVPVEFCLNSGATEAPGEQGTALLVEMGLAPTPDDARHVFLMLFWHVFSLLGQRGEKRLAANGWKELLSAAPEDRALALMTEVLSLAEGINTRLDRQAEMLSRIDAHTERDAIVAAVQAGIRGIVPTTPVLRAEPPGKPPPVPAAHVSHPDFLVARDMLQASGWLELTGVSGSGKSQLARQLHEGWTAGPRLWISANGAAQGLRYRVAAAMWQLIEPTESPGSVPNDLEEVVNAVVAGEPGTLLLVLDDLPDVLADKETELALAELAGIAAAQPLRIVSTSTFNLTSPVLTALGRAASTFRPSPFGVAEASDLLRQSGAPANLLESGLPAYLIAATSGHPQLLSAAVFSLAARQWSADAVGAILTGDALADAKEEARSKVRKLVLDAKARELLDRISLVSTTFPDGLVDALALVSPSISNPQDRFHELVGPWVARLAPGAYELAPQLRGVGRTYLSMSVRRGVDSAIASSIISQRVLSPDDAFNACMHLAQGEQWLRLAAFYLQFLMALIDEGIADRVGWPSWIFPTGTPWPAEVPTHLRISIRATQIAAAFSPVGPLEDELESLIDHAGESRAELVAVAHARFQAAIKRDGLAPAARCRAAIQMARAWRKADLPHEGGLPPVDPALLWWAGAMHATNLTDQQQVLATLDGLTAKETAAIFAPPESAPMAAILCEWWYAAAELDPAGVQQHLAAVDALEWLSAVEGCEYVGAILARVRALIMSDRFGQIDAATEILAPFCDSPDPVQRFIGSWTTARILSSKSRDADALYLFARALNCELDISWRGHLVDCTVHGATCAARLSDPSRARRWLLAGIRLTREAPKVDQFQLADLYSELALLLWNGGEWTKAAAALLGSARVLEKYWPTNQARGLESLWKMGHLSGWLCSVARTGQPPAATADGSVYVEPFPGFAFRRNEAMATVPTLGGFSVLYYQIGELFGAAASQACAGYAYEKAASIAVAEGRIGIRAMALGALAPYEASRGNYVDSIAYAMAQAGVAAQARGAGFDVLTTEGFPEPPEAMAEFAVFYEVIWPAFLRLLAEPASSLEPLSELDRLRAALVEAHCTERAVNLVEACRRAFTGDEARSIFADARAEADGYLQLILYAACAAAPDIAIGDKAGCYAVVITSPSFAQQPPAIRAAFADYVVSQVTGGGQGSQTAASRDTRGERRSPVVQAAIAVRAVLSSTAAKLDAGLARALDELAAAK